MTPATIVSPDASPSPTTAAPTTPEPGLEPGGSEPSASRDVDSPAALRTSGRRRRVGLGIQSKLLAMLLGVSLLTALVVGFVGYRSGTSSLRAAAEDRLVQVRESRARELGQYFTNLQNALVIDTRGTTAIDAVQGFTSGFDQLDQQPANATQAAAVKKFYDTSFIPDYEKATGSQLESDTLLPTTPAQQALQAAYTVRSDDYDTKIGVDDAGDGSAYSKAHATYHDYFRELTVRYGYEDVFLLDTRGNVVYSAYKGVDLGTNVDTGPYRGGNLQKVYDAAIRSNSLDFFGMTDFENYQPSLGAPTAFAASPIGKGGRIDGVLVVQLPTERINTLMTGDGAWAAEGLGQTGETYLVGPDRLMRSNARELIENPEQFQADVVAAGTPLATAQEEVRRKSSVLLQPVDTPAVGNALRGETGIAVGPGYLGKDALTAYAPLDIDGVQWVIIAKITEAEAYAPVTAFARNLALSTAGLILLICLASLLLAQVFTRPVKRLVAGVRRVAGGDLTTQVPLTSRDEFGDLGAAFNDMSRSLRTKAELLDEQVAENDRLLLTLMPEAVARRYRDGEETIAEEHNNVSVIFADIVGIEELTRDLSPHDSLSLTNALTRSFDEAAERLGVDKVRPLRNGYVASCGLVVPRLDNARRVLDFAVEMERALHRFNVQHGASLALRAGIDTGTVSSGLVGRSSLVYDLWGDAVNLAYQIRNAGGRPGIFVTGPVYDRLRNDFAFAPATANEAQQGRTSVWMLETEASRA